MQAGIRARAGRASVRRGALGMALVIAAAVGGLGGFSSLAWANATLSANVAPAMPGSVAVTLTTVLDSDPTGPPSDQLGSVAYTLPSEFSDQIAQLPTCDPSTFIGPMSSVSVSLTQIATGVTAPSNCPADSVLGTANAELFEALLPHAPLTAPGGEIVHTSGAYPLTLWLNYNSPALGQIYIALGGTVVQSGGQTVLTFDTDDAKGATDSQDVALAYGIPMEAAPFVALNDLTFTFSANPSAAAFAATGCSNGLWAFSAAITYTGLLTTSGGYDTYVQPAPPAVTASATVPCTGSGAAAPGGSSGSSGSTGGSGGVSGSTTTTPGNPKAAAVCVVPRVQRGATLSLTENALKKAHCAVGHISKERSKTVVRKGKVIEHAVPKGRVISIADRSGTKLKVNSRVNVTVSSG